METSKELMKLIEIGKEMNKQDHRATAFPLFLIQRKVRDYRPDGEDTERIEDTDTELLCESCKNLYLEDDELQDQCDNCQDEAFHFFNYEWKLDTEEGVFFTAEECDAVINSRPYAYGKTARSYGIGAHRSGEMKTVMQYLSALGADEGKPHNNYRR